LDCSRAIGVLGTVKYLRYIFKYVSALNRNLSATEMFSGRYGLCRMRTDTVLYHHSWETVVVGEIRLCRSSFASQTECISYHKAASNSVLAYKIIIWHLSAFCLWQILSFC